MIQPPLPSASSYQMIHATKCSLTWNNLSIWSSCSNCKHQWLFLTEGDWLLTTGNAPEELRVSCLVKDSIWSHTSTGVQHNIQSPNQKTWGRDRKEEKKKKKRKTFTLFKVTPSCYLLLHIKELYKEGWKCCGVESSLPGSITLCQLYFSSFTHPHSGILLLILFWPQMSAWMG